MRDEPEIVKEMREAEKLGKLQSKTPSIHHKYQIKDKPKRKEDFETDEELDEMWFSLWNCL